MTDDWDFYFVRVDGAPASIQVDLGLEPSVPLAALPHLAHVRVPMLAPRPDGLSSSEEFDALIALEDALTASVVDDRTVYVGRCTGNGTRDFYFYAADLAHWPQRVAAALASFAVYRPEAGGRADPTWSVYREFLMPGDEDRQRIENRRVCAALESHGDPLTVARDIDHWSYFASDVDAQSFADAAEHLGFHVRRRASDGRAEEPHLVQLARSDVPSFHGIDAVVLPLFRAARDHRGRYDGWECAVVRAGSES